jgi:hypothetical protein
MLSVLAGWVLAIGVQLWDVDRPAWTIVEETLLLVGLSAVRGATPGMTASSVKRLAWMPDGSWRLCDGYGWQWSARLAAGSRKWGPVAILMWNDGTRRSWAILTPAAVGPTQYRRFSVRWHLRRHA